MHLQIGVLGLDISFLRRLECGLRLGLASARTLRPEQISRFFPAAAAPWRQSAVISWSCRSWRIVTVRVSVRACIRGVLCTFLSFSQQMLGQLLRPFDTAHLGIAQLVAAEVIPLAVLGRVPQLPRRRSVPSSSPRRINSFGADLTRSFKVCCTCGFSLILSIYLTSLQQGGALAPPWFYYAAKSEGLVVISL